MIIHAKYVKYWADVYFIFLVWLEQNAPGRLGLPKHSRILVQLSTVLGIWKNVIQVFRPFKGGDGPRTQDKRVLKGRNPGGKDLFCLC